MRYVPGTFKKFGSLHPGSTQRAANDYQGHMINGLTVSDLDGTPKIYSGYGGISVNLAPIYVWPLSLDGVWDATYAHSFNGYALQFYEHLEGKLWCVSGDHSASGSDFCTGSPGGMWVDGKCAPWTTGFQHPFWITRHDGYTWVTGQTYVPTNGGGVWRGTDPTGAGGEYVLIDMPPGETLNRPTTLFSYQGKLWYQAGYYTNRYDAKLRYWDEASHTFLDSGLKFEPNSGYVRRWKDKILSVYSASIQSFNGTAVTKPYNPQLRIDWGPPVTVISPPYIVDIFVTPDDTVWMLEDTGVFKYSTDLVNWTVWSQTDRSQLVSFTIYEDHMYMGDTHDQIWRAKLWEWTADTLTRRDRVAVGATQGGALYYGDKRRWPEPAPGVFEKFGSLHPGAIQRAPSDVDGHKIAGFTVSDLDGTPKLYSGYGSALLNVAPIYIWPLGLDGTWDPAPAHTFNAFGMRQYHHAEGKLWCFSDQGPSAFCSGSPGGSWIDGKCPPWASGGNGNDGGMTHAGHIARHDGYTWVCGQWTTSGQTGAVWRGADPTGVDGEFLFGTPLGQTVYQPVAMFSYQGKLWMQPNPLGVPGGFLPYEGGRLCYWDEASYKFLPIDLLFPQGNTGYTPWKTVMLISGSSGVDSFNGTTLTRVYNSQTIVDIFVTPDDTVWVLGYDGVLRSSTDLVTWPVRMQVPAAISHTRSFTVYGDFVYIGDEHDQIWRAKVTA